MGIETIKAENAAAKTAQALADEIAVWLEADALATRNTVWEAVCADHAADLAAWQFECRRWGDFLQLALKRRRVHWSEPASVVTFATAVNLRDTRQFLLQEGHAADFGFTLTYRVTSEWATSGRDSEWFNAKHRFKDATSTNYWWEVKTQFEAEPWRLLFELDAPRADGGGITWSQSRSAALHITRTTAGWPRHAADDSIRFDGVNGTLYVPFGRGAEVRDAILAAVAGT